jgi:WXG100 family type VII secretion target
MAQLNLSTEELWQLHKEYEAAAQRISDELLQLRGRTQVLDSWVGASASSFNQVLAQMDRLGNELVQNIATLSQLLRASADAFQSAESSLRESLR